MKPASIWILIDLSPNTCSENNRYIILQDVFLIFISQNHMLNLWRIKNYFWFHSYWYRTKWEMESWFLKRLSKPDRRWKQENLSNLQISWFKTIRNKGSKDVYRGYGWPIGTIKLCRCLSPHWGRDAVKERVDSYTLVVAVLHVDKAHQETFRRLSSRYGILLAGCGSTTQHAITPGQQCCMK